MRGARSAAIYAWSPMTQVPVRVTRPIVERNSAFVNESLPRRRDTHLRVASLASSFNPFSLSITASHSDPTPSAIATALALESRLGATMNATRSLTESDRSRICPRLSEREPGARAAVRHSRASSRAGSVRAAARAPRADAPRHETAPRAPGDARCETACSRPASGQARW